MRLLMFCIRNEVYGYEIESSYGDNYLYYNATKVENLGLEDPCELWFKGQWTYENFDNWVTNAASKLDEGENVLDLMYATFVLGYTS